MLGKKNVDRGEASFKGMAPPSFDHWNFDIKAHAQAWGGNSPDGGRRSSLRTQTRGDKKKDP